MTSIAWLKKTPIAHRGLHDGNRKVWENTLSAFDCAMAQKYPIECDIHLTRDGVPMVFHDEDINRLTGQTGRVSDMTAKELMALTIGGTQDHPPTLAQMLAHVAGKVPLVIELKGVEGKDDGLVGSVAKALAHYRGKAALMSFDHHLIRRFAKDAPGLPGGLTAEGVKDADMEAHFSMLAHGIAFVSYNIHHMPNRFVAHVRKNLKLPVISWTVRTPGELAKTHAEADQATFELFDPRHTA